MTHDLRVVAFGGGRELAEVFGYRFESGVESRDHTVGNIVIAALANPSGGISEAVEQAARLLRINRALLTAATESLTLLVRYVDGLVTRGESAVLDAGKAVARRPRRKNSFGIPLPPWRIELANVRSSQSR